LSAGAVGFVLYTRPHPNSAAQRRTAPGGVARQNELPPAPAPAREPAPREPVRTDAKLIRQVEAERPLFKKLLREKGPVRFSAIVTTGGRLTDFVLLSSQKGLAAAAQKAAEKWRYEPATVDGRPVEQSVTIEVNFKN